MPNYCPKPKHPMFHLVDEWKIIAKYAWSARLMALALFFTAAEAVLPLFIDDIPRFLFAGLTALTVCGAFWANLVRQNGFE